MRFIWPVFVALLCAMPTVVRGSEPFGLDFIAESPVWRTRLQERFDGPDRDLVLQIAEQVRAQPIRYWLNWVNQLGNLSGVGNCAPVAAIKREVLIELGFDKKDLRIVVFDVTRGDGPLKLHATLTVRLADMWYVLDKSIFVRDHRVLKQEMLASWFEPLYTLD